MKLLIFKFFYFIYLFSSKNVKTENLENKNCELNNKNIDCLGKENKIFNNYEYSINPASITNIQGMLIIGLLEKFRPNNICEFGAGVSTIIFETYCEKYNKKLLNIEHDIKYKRKDSKLFNLIENTFVVINNVKYGKTNKYEGLEDFFKNYKGKFDFVFIDGPFGYNKKYKYTRIQMIDLLEFNLLEDHGYFLVHDTERKNAKNSIQILLSLFKKKGYKVEIEYLSTHKQKRLTIINFNKK
jgi:predicted O-methyltransferase YrrM